MLSSAKRLLNIRLLELDTEPTRVVMICAASGAAFCFRTGIPGQLMCAPQSSNATEANRTRISSAGLRLARLPAC